jgi:hypothetical protein
MGRLGRRKLPDDQRRTAATLNVRLNEHELKVVEQKAELAGISPTEWARQAALERDPPPRRIIPELNREAWLELSKLTATLNGKLWHFQALTESDLSASFEAVRRQLETVRNQLLGNTK